MPVGREREREKSRRACGGLITGVKWNITEIEVEEKFRSLQERRVIIQGKIWRIITVYSKDMKKTRSNIEEMVEATEEERLIIGGDINARTEKGGSFCDEVIEREIRKSKDKITNTEGVRLLEMVEENEWEILNGNMEGDGEGEFTFIGAQGNSVIDYILADTKMKEEIQNFRIDERVESNHLPMVVEIYGDLTQEQQTEEQLKEIRIWTEEGRKFYQEKINKVIFEKEETDEIMKEMIQKMIQKMNGAVLKKTLKIEKTNLGYKRWWDRECTEKKRKARKALRS